MQNAPYELIVQAASELFFDRGFTEVTVSEIARKANVSETTLRRYFKDGKADVFAAVLRAAAQSVRKRYLEHLESKGLDMELSEPRLLAIAYVDSVLSQWATPGPERWDVNILFGFDGTAAGQIIGPTVSSEAMADVELLDLALTRGCNGDEQRARNLSCVILGALGEFVRAELSVPDGYDRHYVSTGVVDMIDVLLLNALRPQTVTKKALEQSGVSQESLRRLKAQLDTCSRALEEALERTTG